MTWDRRDTGALTLVVAVAAIARLWHVAYGLPEAPYVDAFRFVTEAQRLAFDSRGFDPIDFMHPGLLKVVMAVLYGTFDVHEPVAAHVVGRLVCAACDLGTVVAVFVVGRRFGGRLAGMAGGIVYASCVVAVTSSRIITTDTMLAFFLTLSMAVMTKERIRGIDFLLAGMFVGCAIGTKMTGLYGGLSLLTGAVIGGRDQLGYRRAFLYATGAGVLSLVVFLATTPWFLGYAEAFWAAIQVQAEAQRYGQIGHIQSTPIDYLISSVRTWEQPWLHSSILYTMGPVVLLGGLSSIAIALAGRWGPGPRAWALYVVVFLVLVSGTGRVKAVRYILAILPAWSILIGVGTRAALDRWPPPERLRGWTAGLALAALVLGPAYRTVPFVVATGRPTTNALAHDWAIDHLPPGSRVLLTPFYLENLAALPIDPRRLKGAAQLQYRLRESLGVDTEQEPLFRPELVDRMPLAGIRYVILNSSFEGNLYDTEENRRFFPVSVAAYAAFRQRLDERGTKLWEVEGWRAGRVGPDIAVYRLE